MPVQGQGQEPTGPGGQVGAAAEQNGTGEALHAGPQVRQPWGSMALPMDILLRNSLDSWTGRAGCAIALCTSGLLWFLQNRADSWEVVPETAETFEGGKWWSGEAGWCQERLCLRGAQGLLRCVQGSSRWFWGGGPWGGGSGSTPPVLGQATNPNVYGVLVFTYW